MSLIHAPATGLLLLLALAVLWLVAQRVSVARPVTATAIIDLLLFVVLLVWFVVSVVGLAR